VLPLCAQFYTIMRDQLQRVLLSSIPKQSVRFGKEVASLNEQQSGVQLTFADGSVSDCAYDLVVGADGIKGAVKVS
jgi:2-polyprenyl-6-methoxyphenol hydroxylase-like FAD-dependent oxidoreductase